MLPLVSNLKYQQNKREDLVQSEPHEYIKESLCDRLDIKAGFGNGYISYRDDQIARRSRGPTSHLTVCIDVEYACEASKYYQG